MQQIPNIEGETIQSDQVYQLPELPTSLLSSSNVSRVKLTESEANELAEQVGQRNQEAGSKLYDAYVEAIYSFFYHRTNNTDETQDLTSETFLRAINGLLDGTWSGHPFPARLFETAKDIFIEWRKTHTKQSNFIDKDFNIQKLEREDKDVLQEILTRERSTIIWEVVDQLPEAFNSILKLRYMHSLSYAEIAWMREESIDACRTLHRRAMEMLREELKKTSIWNEIKRD
jgi:RNA polymerase sigma factor (sigma-70 family)